MRALIRCLALVGLALSPASGPAAPHPAASDPKAVAVAESVLEKMGGREGWDRVRVLRWRFFGKRLHYWDKQTGDVRIEADSAVVLMNVNTRTGRVWNAGAEVTDPAALKEALEAGYAMWVNDSYWLLMPYKMLDPGVKLADHGESAMADGRSARLLSMTFDGVGLTPANKYDVWVGTDSGLVEQWAYYETSTDEDPKFTSVWGRWTKFGPILLPTERGRGGDWEIAVFEDRPAGVFETP